MSESVVHVDRFLWVIVEVVRDHQAHPGGPQLGSDEQMLVSSGYRGGVLSRVEVEGNGIADQGDVFCILLSSHRKRPTGLFPVFSHFGEDTEDVPGNVTGDVLFHRQTGHGFGFFLLG